MSFTFPTDASGNAGAVHSNNAGTDFYVPVREQGSEVVTANLITVPTAGTAVQLPSIPCRKIMLIGLRANTGYIYVGGSNVTSSVYGVDLGARDSMTIEISNANLLYINSTVNGEGVSYFAI